MRTGPAKAFPSPLVVLAAIALLASPLPSRADPPDSEINPVSGDIETVDAQWETTHYDVNHVTDPGQGQPLESTNLSQNALDDLGPRVAISAGGDTWVVWWRDGSTDQVLVRKHTYSTGSWSGEGLASDASESSRHPELVHDGTDPWVAYELDGAPGTSLAASIITEDTDPFGTRTILATTSYGGDPDVLIHAESGNLWVTWIDSASAVGWSEYDYGTGNWSTPGSESYAADDVAAARARIRTTVLGN